MEGMQLCKLVMEPEVFFDCLVDCHVDHQQPGCHSAGGTPGVIDEAWAPTSLDIQPTRV